MFVELLDFANYFPDPFVIVGWNPVGNLEKKINNLEPAV